MTVTSIRFFMTPVRRQPKVGDRRTTKKHGDQVRVLDILQCGPDAGALVARRGRPCFVWVSPGEAARRHPRLFPQPGADRALPQ